MINDLSQFFKENIQLNEAKTRILNELEKKYGKDRLFSNELDFSFDENEIVKMFNILNEIVFSNKLPKIKIMLTTNDMLKKHIFEKTGIVNDTNYYAIYFPEVNRKNAKIKNETIFIIDNGKMTFLFALNILCHEMIHMYDFHFGDIGKILISNKYERGYEHYSKIFQSFLNNLNKEGIKIMVDGGNTPFDILNHEVVQATLELQEDETEDLPIVKRIVSGEKFDYCGITPRNTLAFVIS